MSAPNLKTTNDDSVRTVIETVRERLSSMGVTPSEVHDAIVRTFYEFSRPVSSAHVHEAVAEGGVETTREEVEKILAILVTLNLAKGQEDGLGETRYEQEYDSDPNRIETILATFHARLQEEELKSTRQRDTIVKAFFRIDKHISADELLSEVRRKRPRIGYATVYRTLKLLVDLGFAVTKDFGDGQTRYDPIHDQDPDHDHLICVRCRKIIEFNDEIVVNRLHEIAEEFGFNLRRRQLELYAECKDPNCNKPKR